MQALVAMTFSSPTCLSASHLIIVFSSAVYSRVHVHGLTNVVKRIVSLFQKALGEELLRLKEELAATAGGGGGGNQGGDCTAPAGRAATEIELAAETLAAAREFAATVEEVS